MYPFGKSILSACDLCLRWCLISTVVWRRNFTRSFSVCCSIFRVRLNEQFIWISNIFSHILDIIWGRTRSWRIFKISSEVMLKICSYLDGSKSGKIAPRTACTTHSSSHKFLACEFNKCHFNILILNTICFKRVTYSHHQWRKWTIKIISILV